MRTTCRCKIIITQLSPDRLYKTECVFLNKFGTKNDVGSCTSFGVGGLSLDLGRLTCGLSVGHRGCLSVVAGALLLERCCCHAFQLAFPFFLFCSYGVFCVGVLGTHNSNRHNKSNSSISSTREHGVGVEDVGIERLAFVVVEPLPCASTYVQPGIAGSCYT